MKNQFFKISLLLTLLFVSIISCSSENESIGEVAEEEEDETIVTTLHTAFAEFDTNETTIYVSGTDVVIETTGLPNHTTPYWSESHPLYVAPTITSAAEMTPTRIDTSNRDNSSSLTVAASSNIASSSTDTQLGSIGIAVSGAYLYNDQEGSGALDAATGSLDYTGAHIGPTDYHYHLEPLAFSNDDEKLIGVISDGFFIYGRKCNSTGTYPTDLDISGGHTSTTQHTETAEYHYHIMNELYSNTGRYIVFAGPYQGTPNAIN
jgi:hypothetical protein